MTRRLIAITALCGAVGCVFWLMRIKGPKQPQKSANESQRIETVRDSRASEGAARKTVNLLRPRQLEPVQKQYLDGLRRALDTNDPVTWEPILSELVNPRLDRTSAIEALIPLLGYPNWLVKVRVAQDLLELGSYEGVPILQRALKDGALGQEDISRMVVLTAAQVLHQYRQAIDGTDFYTAYERFGDQHLLDHAALHEAPQVRDFIATARARGDSPYQTERLAAYLGLKDNDTIQRYTALAKSTNDYPAQLLSHWAFYQPTGNAADLDYVIGSAREYAGMDPRSERSQPWSGTDAMAFDFLKITVTPQSTRALEQIADFAAGQPDGNINVFMRAFGALFYLHHDYEYVDDRTASFMRGDYEGPSISRALLWKVAAARNIPSINEMARKVDTVNYEQTYILMRGRPVESRTDLSLVPIRVAPPLKLQNN